ncbi:MAG: hypothetical protein AB8G95_02980 [Anaerolineae bacterium]
MTAVVAIICGLLVFYFEKGSWKHVILGRLYFASMSLMAIISFGINEVNGSFSIFHFISIQSLIFLFLAILVSRFLRVKLPTWEIWHGRFMVYSYITLLITGMAQFFDRLPIENTTIRALIFLTLPAILMWYYFEFKFTPRQIPKSKVV